jgi:RimJ/RimL family protein N-acetyltransferase
VDVTCPHAQRHANLHPAAATGRPGAGDRIQFLPPHLIDQLMDVDYRQRMTFVATVERDGVEEFVGIARYGETDQEGAAELGVTVTDSVQRCGIARLLVTQLMRFARWRGISALTGLVLTDNQPMIERRTNA